MHSVETVDAANEKIRKVIAWVSRTAKVSNVKDGENKLAFVNNKCSNEIAHPLQPLEYKLNMICISLACIETHKVEGKHLYNFLPGMSVLPTLVLPVM